MRGVWALLEDIPAWVWGFTRVRWDSRVLSPLELGCFKGGSDPSHWGFPEGCRSHMVPAELSLGGTNMPGTPTAICGKTWALQHSTSDLTRNVPTVRAS